VHAARVGDADAVGCLFDLHYSTIFRYIYVRTGRVEDAEDLAQEVFVRMVGAIDRYEDRGAPFRAWLLRIAANLVRDHYRRRGTRPPASSTDAPGFDLPADDDPTEAVARQLALRDVAAAMHKLSPAEREVVQLRFGADLSVAETAAALGKNENTVKQLSFKALGKLRKALQ
jgi:RNA polymerase sigma-70 factor (ECF subfamily)